MSDEQQDPKWIVDVLGEILAPLGRERDAILAWVKREIATRAIVQYVYEEGPPTVRDPKTGEETGGPQIWKLGEPNPLDPSETIFAMFYWEEGERVVAVYTFSQKEIEGQQATFFFRSLIFRPIHVHGPVHHSALIHELGSFLNEVDVPERELEPAQTNGAP